MSLLSSIVDCAKWIDVQWRYIFKAAALEKLQQVILLKKKVYREPQTLLSFSHDIHLCCWSLFLLPQHRGDPVQRSTGGGHRGWCGPSFKGQLPRQGCPAKRTSGGRMGPCWKQPVLLPVCTWRVLQGNAESCCFWLRVLCPFFFFF